MIAALYVDPRGPYPLLPGVECWDSRRDARLYPGPWPVIAHPPCGPWGRYHQRCHQDASLAPAAVAAVRRWGGVLEHPIDSNLWPACRLPMPGWLPDPWGGWSIKIDQCHWGHPARKRSWLYVVGIGQEELPPIPPWQEPTRMLEDMAKSARHLTPPLFAAWLVRLVARHTGSTHSPCGLLPPVEGVLL